MESALRPPLPTATRAFAEIQIQARLTNRSGQNIITSIRGSRCQVADIKSEPRPASNRNAWPASSESAQPPAQPHRRVSIKRPIRLADGSYLEVVRPSAQCAVRFAHQRCGLLPCARSVGQRVDLLDHPLNAFL